MMKSGRIILPALAVLLTVGLFTACGRTAADEPAALTPAAEEPAALTAPAGEPIVSTSPSPDWVVALGQANRASQLFVVAGVGPTTATISLHETDADGNWREILTTPGYIGKKGLGKTKEGDGMTPVGVFRFNAAFGIAADPGCALPYHQVSDDDYWSGDVRDGYHYNEMVRLSDLPELDTAASEHLIDYTANYQYCLNISYNEDCVPGAGSAIFLHCLDARKPYTGGCVAIPQQQMERVLQLVREDCVVVIDSLQKLSPETWEQWGLPAADAQSN